MNMQTMIETIAGWPWDVIATIGSLAYILCIAGCGVYFALHKSVNEYPILWLWAAILWPLYLLSWPLRRLWGAWRKPRDTEPETYVVGCDLADGEMTMVTMRSSDGMVVSEQRFPVEDDGPVYMLNPGGAISHVISSTDAPKQPEKWADDKLVVYRQGKELAEWYVSQGLTPDGLHPDYDPAGMHGDGFRKIPYGSKVSEDAKPVTQQQHGELVKQFWDHVLPMSEEAASFRDRLAALEAKQEPQGVRPNPADFTVMAALIRDEQHRQEIMKRHIRTTFGLPRVVGAGMKGPTT